MGGTRLAKDTVVGVAGGGVVTDVLGFVGRGIDSFGGREGAKVRQKKSDNIASGVYHGGRQITTGVFKGVSGVFTKPIKGAQSSGAKGFFKGLGQGLVGAVSNPIMGVAGGVGSIFEGASSSVNKLTGGARGSSEEGVRPLKRIFKGWELKMLRYENRETSVVHKCRIYWRKLFYRSCCLHVSLCGCTDTGGAKPSYCTEQN